MAVGQSVSAGQTVQEIDFTGSTLGDVLENVSAAFQVITPQITAYRQGVLYQAGGGVYAPGYGLYGTSASLSELMPLLLLGVGVVVVILLLK